MERASGWIALGGGLAKPAIEKISRESENNTAAIFSFV